MEQGRVWLAVFLSLALFFAYDYFVLSPYREAAKREQTTATLPAPPAPAPGTAEVSTVEISPPVRSGAPILIETDLFRATIDSLGGRLREFRLKRYRATVDGNSQELDLVPIKNIVLLPLTLQFGSGSTDQLIQYDTDQTMLTVTGDQEVSVDLRGRLPSGRELHKKFSFSGSSYVFRMSVEMAEEDGTTVGVLLPPITADSAKAEAEEKAMSFSGGRLTERLVGDVGKEAATQEGVLWAGYASQYFVSLVVSGSGFETVVTGPISGIPAVQAHEQVENGKASFEILIGPKDRQVLQAAGSHLERAIDFGWFWFIAIPLLHLLRFFDSIFGNYGVAIILLTVLVKAATIPLTRVQYRSMQKMQQIQPHLEKLRERHKDDASGMQREMMELYKRHGVNPFSGCVPMLLQIPIFVGLYNALLNAIELRHAPFVGWITDLSAPDRLMIAGIGVPVLVILMGASMLAQQWMTPMQGDPTQRRMMMFMPVIFTAMFLNFPSGLVLYWLVNNVISIGQQYAVVGAANRGAGA